MIKVTEAAAKPGVEETRQRILAATRELFALKGSRGTTTREVADRAGVNEATLFRHFGTKAALIDAMRDHYCSAPEGLRAALAEHATLEERLRALGNAILTVMLRNEDIMRVSMAEAQTDPDGAAVAWRGPVENIRIVEEFFAAQVAAQELSGDPRELSRIFASLFIAYVLANKLWLHGRPTPERFVKLSTDIFLNGARKP